MLVDVHGFTVDALAGLVRGGYGYALVHRGSDAGFYGALSVLRATALQREESEIGARRNLDQQ